MIERRDETALDFISVGSLLSYGLAHSRQNRPLHEDIPLLPFVVVVDVSRAR